MEIIVSTRHGEVPESLRARAERVMAHLAQFAHRPTAAHVTFDMDHQRATAEVRLSAARGAVHIASAEAMDRVASKLRRQLDKRGPSARRRTARR
jgi:ribosome-associated translation inhibitor RaiA